MFDNQGYISETLFSTLHISIYSAMVFVALLSSISIDMNNKLLPNKLSNPFIIFFSILFIGIVGFREYNVGTDTEVYYNQWLSSAPPVESSEIIFDTLMSTLKKASLSFTSFLLLVAFLFYFFMARSLSKLSHSQKANAFLVVFCLFSLFFTSTMSINIMRQGLSLSFLLYSYSLWATNSKSKFILYFAICLSILTHTTSIIPLIIFIFINIFCKKTSLKYFNILYLIGIILAAANIGLLNIAPFIADILGESSKRIGYLQGSNELYSVGFKPQFVAFNTVFLILSLYSNRFRLSVQNNYKEKYEILLKYFITSSILFFMTFQIPYSDRWGLFSWITIPLLMIPFFSDIKNKKQYRSIIVLFFASIYIFFQVTSS